jgi:hypothetical protein
MALEGLQRSFGLLGIIPKIGRQGRLFQVGYFKTSFIDVKDTSLERPRGFAGLSVDPESWLRY